MIVLLRFIGVLNAAVWFGATVFFLLGVTPASYSADLKLLLKGNFDCYSTIIDVFNWERFIPLQIWCGSVALLHQLAEWLYLGRRFQRLTTWLVLGLLGAVLIDGFWLQPRLQALHQVKYSYRKTAQGYEAVTSYTNEQRVKATVSLQRWERVGRVLSLGLHPGKLSLGANWPALVALALLLWRIANPADMPRFAPPSKFRS